MSLQTPSTVFTVFGLLALVLASGGLRPASAQQEGGGQGQRQGKFEVYPDRSGEFRWRLKSSNGQVIATGGQAYKDKRDCRAAIDAVKRTAAAAPVEEVAAQQQGEAAGAPDGAAGERPTGKRPAR